MTKKKKNKSKARLYLSIFLPSKKGLVTYAALATAFLVFRKVNLINNLANFINRAMNNFLGAHISNIIIAGVIYALIGFALYFVVFEIVNFVRHIEYVLDLKEHSRWPNGANPNGPLEHLILRATFRLVIAIMAVIYIVKMLSPVTSKFINTYDLKLQSFTNLTNWLWSLVVLIISLHCLTILLRLFFLRQKLNFKFLKSPSLSFKA